MKLRAPATAAKFALIDENGRIVETCYGRDAGDHIPIKRLELFVARGIAARASRQ